MTNEVNPSAERTPNFGSVVALRATAASEINPLAMAIYKYTQEERRVEVHCIGAGPINQGLKAVVRARQLASARGMCLAVIPWMQDITSDREGQDGVVSVMILRVIALHEKGLNV